MRFLLVISTLGRTSELRRFLQSACAQTYSRFEVVVVDQNDDDRVERVLAEFDQVLQIRLVKSARRGLALGRNIGLNIASDADVITFPDDDCWYPPQLLARV